MMMDGQVMMLLLLPGLCMFRSVILPHPICLCLHCHSHRCDVALHALGGFGHLRCISRPHCLYGCTRWSQLMCSSERDLMALLIGCNGKVLKSRSQAPEPRVRISGWGCEFILCVVCSQQLSGSV